jgi:hypothetical protein
MKILISILLILHGLIVVGQSAGSFGSTIPNEIQNPAFVSWWPVNMGRSWLFSWLGLEKTLAVYRISGLLWLVGGIVLVAAGLGLLGLIIPTAWWRDLALTGGAISLFMLVIYLHPLMIIGTASSLAVIVSLLWTRWPAMSMLP